MWYFFEKMLGNCIKMAQGWCENAVFRGKISFDEEKSLRNWEKVMEKLAYLIGFYGNIKEFKLNRRCKRDASGFLINEGNFIIKHWKINLKLKFLDLWVILWVKF